MLTLSFCELCCTFLGSFLQETMVERPLMSKKLRSYRVTLRALLTVILANSCSRADGVDVMPDK